MEVLIVSRFLNIFFVLSCLFCLNAAFVAVSPNSQKNVIYVGSYSKPDGKGTGIVILSQNKFTKKYEYSGNISALSPSALTADPDKGILYSVNELNRFKGETGSISSYRISDSTMELTFVNSQSSLGWQPNFIALDPSENFLMVTNYGTGRVVIYEVQNGRIGRLTDDVYGYGKNCHQIVFSPSQTVAAIPYLGSDVVYFFKLDKVQGKLHPLKVSVNDGTTMFHRSAVVASGSGPRHMVFSKDSSYFYVIGELLSTVTVFRTDLIMEKGQFMAIQVVSLIPDDYEGRRWAAAIVLHPEGTFLYASERGLHHIAIFKVNPRSGKLTFLKFCKCGKIPRDMAIRPSGEEKFQLFVTNEGNHAIQIFNIGENGDLSLSYTIRGINSPTYLQFYP